MRTKKILPAYIPARLMKGNTWYIIVYVDGKRYRKTFSLNRIFHIPTREKRGNDLVEKINWWLNKGNKLSDFNERKVIIKRSIEEAEENISIKEAIEIARDLKLKDIPENRRTSIKTVKKHSNYFLTYLDQKKLSDLPIKDFSKKEAIRCVDSWAIKNPHTFNGRLAAIKSYFNLLLDREYIHKNPFGTIKGKRRMKANRPNWSLEEMAIIGATIKDRNKWLWMASQLAFWGLIRNEELTRLRFKYFDLENWCIRMPGDITKNYKDDVITLPQFLRKEFIQFGFFDFPANYLIFGENCQPHPKNLVSEFGINGRHKHILKVLSKEGKYEKKTGQSFATWRRTGMDYFSKTLTPREFKDHNRHDSFQTTERYLPNRGLIPKISKMEKIEL